MEFDPGILAEGKTKIIWTTRNPKKVRIESKDDITAGDGARRDVIAGKAAYATETTANCFKLLRSQNIPTHYIRKVGDTAFTALKVDMIPIELVARRIAFGSYLKRSLDTASGTRFSSPIIEFFEKDDSKHDPLLVAESNGAISRYDPTKPLSAGPLSGDFLHTDDQLRLNLWPDLASITLRTFTALEAAWAKQDVTLVDMKIEAGITTQGGVVVADVIDNDSWRIWPGGDPSKMVDKQLYRDGRSLDYVADRYAWVATATQQFVAAD